LARVAVYARNQLQCVIASHLGETPDPHRNGEYSLLERLAPHCATFADVGANRGMWSEHLLEHSAASGTLFEPGATSLAILREKFRDGRAEVVPMVVSDEVGSVEFVEEGNSGEGSSAAETFDGNLPVRARSVVPATTLDAFYGDGVRLDLLKVDTEGFDLKVLFGARRLLEQQRIRFIQFEYNSHWLGAGASLRRAYRYLEGLGYRVFLIRSDGLYELDLAFWGDYFRYSNFFACREDSVGVVAPMLRGRL
jgi:FkbM family methyltransferase